MKNIPAKEAWHFLERHSEAVLIDVRTPQEWEAVGFPDLRSLGRSALALTWNPEALEEFQHMLREKVPAKETPIMFLCRSGVRSHFASDVALSQGYEKVTNITDGFEDRHGPGTGWRASGLPFVLHTSEDTSCT